MAPEKQVLTYTKEEVQLQNLTYLALPYEQPKGTFLDFHLYYKKTLSCLFKLKFI